MTELSELGVVTKAGIAAAIDAGRTGPEIKITGFRLGTLSAAEGAKALETDTDVEGFIYEGTTSQMRYSRVNDDTVVWRIALGQEVGDFDVGNIGLMTDSGVMFAKAVLVGQSNKYKSNPPSIIGNRKFYNVVLILSNVSNLLDLTIVESMEASLPEVPTEAELPDANSTPFNAYLVLNHTHIGRPTVAVRTGGEWFHRSQYLYPNQGIGVLASIPGMYHASATVGKVVHYDAGTSKFILSDGADANLQADGIRTSTYEMTTTGMLSGLEVGLTLPLTPGQVYYTGTGGTVGTLTTTVLGTAVAIAVNTTDLWINLGGTLQLGAGTVDDPEIYITIDPDSVDPLLPAGSVVFLNSGSRIWQAADSLDIARRPVGILNKDKTRVVLLGKVEITPVTAAWPKPLTTGALYYAGTGVNEGTIVASNATRFIVGTAHGANALMVRFEAMATNNEHLSANAGVVNWKSATPSGVKDAVDEHANSRNHPSATNSALGFGRPATDAEILAGEAAALPAYQSPWVTPEQLANYNFVLDTSNIVLKSGSTMNSDADLLFQGTGDPMKAGAAYWHPSNDGNASGLDADLLGGVANANFMRNNRDIEPSANGKTRQVRDTANGNRGIVQVIGRDSQPGGGRLEFFNGAGDVLNFLLEHATDRRKAQGYMYSDDGVTFEKQFEFDDTGDLWLRKINSKVSALARVHYATTVTGSNDIILSDVSPAVSTYYEGMVVICKLTSTNTGPMRANVMSMGLKDLKRTASATIDPGCAVNGNVLIMVYDGTRFQVPFGLLDNTETQIIDAYDVQYIEANLTGWDYAEISIHNVARKQFTAPNNCLPAMWMTTNPMVGFSGSTIPDYTNFGTQALTGVGNGRSLGLVHSPNVTFALGSLQFHRQYGTTNDYQEGIILTAPFNCGMVPRSMVEQSDLYPTTGDLIHAVGLTYPRMEYFSIIAQKGGTRDYNANYKLSSARLIVRKAGRSLA